jgi:hypothetical protein
VRERDERAVPNSAVVTQPVPTPTPSPGREASKSHFREGEAAKVWRMEELPPPVQVIIREMSNNPFTQ